MLQHLRAALLIALMGCDGRGCQQAPPPSAPAPSTTPASANDSFVAAAVPELGEATPATEVEVGRARMIVSNGALIDTWPAADLERAQTDPAATRDGWPRLRIEIVDLTPRGAQLPSLLEALSETRLAERSATRAGSGASVVDLRFEATVPFATVERVLFTAGLAGYGAPRFVVGEGAARRAIRWPTTRASEEDRRLVIGTARVEGCAESASAAACIAELSLLPGAALVIEVEPTVPFGRLAPYLQHALAGDLRVRVVSRPR